MGLKLDAHAQDVRQTLAPIVAGMQGLWHHHGMGVKRP